MRLRYSLAAVAAAIAAAAGACGTRDRAVLPGFTAGSSAAHLRIEREFLALPDASRLRDTHRMLTSRPHPAGSDRNRELADWIADEFRRAGLDVQMASHEALLSKPLDVRVEMTHPRAWKASMQEPPAQGDPDTAVDRQAGGMAFHAYSASGDVEAPVVYAGEGQPEDYGWLQARGIDVRDTIVIVRQSRRYSYRGYKAYLAQQRGAAGILMFADPAVNGSAEGTPYPEGPWRPDGAIERGAIVYDFLAPGDPLTPGWASLPGAARLARDRTSTLPAIVSAPLSAADARPILEAMEGDEAPAAWQGGLPIAYRTGPGPARVRLLVRSSDRIEPVWTVTGMLRGRESPDHVLVVGNHRDAWLHGGADPSSGTAVLVELARCLGTLVRGGWRPRRSILLASWDAEELALISSTEWAEQHEDWLRDRAIAYLNIDSAASGSRFVAAAAPALARVIAEAAGGVRDPDAGRPVAAVARETWSTEHGVAADRDDDRFVDVRPGGGSDYSVFLHRLGIPIADLAFDGPHGVYHTAYDTHQWVARFGDPGFRYHAALTSVLGLAALRLLEADSLRLDPAASASRLADFASAMEQRLQASGQERHVLRMAPVRLAMTRLAAAAAAFEDARREALERNDRPVLDRFNQSALRFERAFLDPAGLRARPWYRHLVHAPAYTYEPVVFPELEAALDSGDGELFAHEAARLAAALQRAAAQLEPE